MNETRREAVRRVMDIIHTEGMVKEGKLPTERRLAEMTGLSRLILREALIAMEGMGIVDIRNRLGIYLNESNGDELSHVLESAPIWMPSERLSNAMEMRLIIDPAAAAIAAVRRTEEDIAEIEMCLRKLEEIRANAGENEATSGAYWNSVLHGAIFSATRNVLLVRAHDSLKSLTEKGVAQMRGQMPNVDPAWRETILQEHRSIVNAIAQSDPTRARFEMERHIGHTAMNMGRLGQFDDSTQPMGTPEISGCWHGEGPNRPGQGGK